ncbi:hypothetical protein PCANC_27836 [Puccinia coronata f. sp. avenae]|uniref:Uncharacterized protein n=1 Tax=Puccinia coronata f. sp. avenae TaxID=200324 RepID=A0A2N5S294_9BASI|nr:hypothetical protein PCANC_27836 [Puccinia coronata f. sp. avenae]
MARNILPREMTQPFAESLASSRTSSRASSRASHTSPLDGGSSGIEGMTMNAGNGTRRLEDIFTSVMAGATGPSLAEETLRATQHQQSTHNTHPQTHPHSQHHHHSRQWLRLTRPP